MCLVGIGLRLLCVPDASLLAWLAAAALFSPAITSAQPVLQSPAELSAAAVPALEEVIVTARKIREDLYRVPLSVQVLDGDFVAVTDPSSLYELQFDIPGAVVTSAGMFGAGLALRGVTDAGGGGLAVAPHFNGIYLGASSLAVARIFDVERVEVLKGPQGTLYGRNATGGSINVFSRAPGDEFGASLEASVASFDTMRVEGSVNVPAEKLAFRLAVTASDGDGFVRNSVDDRDFAAEDYAGVRASLRVEPASDLTLDLFAQHVDDDGGSSDLWLPPSAYLADPDDIHVATVTHPNPYLSLSSDIVGVDLAYDVGRLALRAVSGYVRSEADAIDDCGGSPRLPPGCLRGVKPDRYEQRSQELRLGSAPDGELEWLVGLYFLESDRLSRYHFSLTDEVPINDYAATSVGSAYAIFAQLTRPLSERWSITGGLRLSHEKERVRTIGSGIRDNAIAAADWASWDDSAWRIGVEYAPDNDLLVFGSIATGFKSGGLTTELLETGRFDDYDPEELTAYELGVNWRPTGLRWTLRGSLFSYDFRDMQVRTIAVVGNRVTNVVDNAAAAHIDGLDLTGTMQATERWTFSGALVWLPRREFVEYVNAVTGDTLSGNLLHRAPEWSASVAIEHVRTFPRAGEFSARIAYNYRSDYFFTMENDPAAAQEAFGLLNIFLRLAPAGRKWDVFASMRNALDQDYFNQVFLQSSAGYPVIREIGFGMRF